MSGNYNEWATSCAGLVLLTLTSIPLLFSTYLCTVKSYISQNPLSFSFWVLSTNQRYSWVQRKKEARYFFFLTLPPCGASGNHSNCTPTLLWFHPSPGTLASILGYLFLLLPLYCVAELVASFFNFWIVVPSPVWLLSNAVASTLVMNSLH